MTYLATSINDSPVIVDKAETVIADVRGRAVALEDGIKLATAGSRPLGVGIMTNDKNIAAGADVHVQIRGIGLVCAGEAITKGDNLEVGADGCLVPESEGPVVAIALEEAAAAGVYIKAILK